MQRTDNKNSKLLIDKMKNEIKQGFDPSLRDIKARYVALEDSLIKVVKAVKWNIIRDGKLLYNLEVLFLAMNDVDHAKYINKLRKNEISQRYCY